LVSKSVCPIQCLEDAKICLDKFLQTPGLNSKFEEAAAFLVETFKGAGKVISCGNGGSMCDAMHFAEELTGRFKEDRPALPALSVSDPSHLTCTGNDYGFHAVFSRFVEAHGRPADVLLAISTSGNSENVLKAVEMAKIRGMKVVALTGKSGGKLSSLCDVEFRAPSSDSERIQEIHIKVIHILIDMVESQMFS
jgi:D-sedoheptulose 7-phosphate isomerase